MSDPISNKPPAAQPETITGYKKGWASSFRRLQLALGWWGLLILVAGWLHNTNSNITWSTELTLAMWVGLAVLGMTGSYLLAPGFLASGIIFIWAGVIVVGFLITWLVLYPLGGGDWPFLSVSWHLVFALGYFLNGHFSDRRLWWLAGWELLMAFLMAYVGLNPPLKLPNGLRSAGNSLVINGFNFYANQGLLLGLTSGLPLIIAALPFWKEHYSRG
jgi:hypothetical protein